MTLNRVLVVYKKSRYQLYVKEHQIASISEAIARGDALAQRFLSSHQALEQTLAAIRNILQGFGAQVVERWRAHMRTSNDFDLVISVGGDGTLLDTSYRMSGGTPLLGINSNPQSSVGALLCGTADRLPDLLERLLSGTSKPKLVTRLQVRLPDGTVIGPCLNDLLYAHASPAEMSRFQYRIVASDEAERVDLGAEPEQHNSGLWVSTAAGSTAAIYSAGGSIMPLGSKRLQYRIREPYYPRNGQDNSDQSRGGMLERGQALVLISRLRRSKIWVDGPHRRVALGYGDRLIIEHSPFPLRLVFDSDRRGLPTRPTT
ncbi:MAG: NAD(+)/NADH kinase [Deltaproteobacteria bacterium]|nr:NAD(+)/NADH kinase [Deltaproteobacteria bacterium]